MSVPYRKRGRKPNKTEEHLLLDLTCYFGERSAESRGSLCQPGGLLAAIVFDEVCDILRRWRVDADYD
jgi:hypothetical protein